MTPEEFFNIYDEIKAELLENAHDPSLINDSIVSTYILLKFKQSAQEGIMTSFQEMNQSFGQVLASQTKNINTNTAELISFTLEKIKNVENMIQKLNS